MIWMRDVFWLGLLGHGTKGAGGKTHLHTPNAVTYHEQSQYCRFMIRHSLGRMESRFACKKAILITVMCGLACFQVLERYRHRVVIPSLELARACTDKPNRV